MADILIIQAARFGDLVQTKRLVASIVQYGTPHLAVDKSLGGLARLLYPDCPVHEMNFHGGDFSSLAADCLTKFEKLKRFNFSRIYNCNFSGISGALCRLFESDRVVGYRESNDSEGGLLRSPWARLAFRLGQTRQTTPLNLVDLWGYFCSNPISPSEVNPPARKGGGGIGITLAGREARRSLPPNLLGDIATTVFKLLGRPPIKLFGSQTEIPVARKLLRCFNPAMHKATRDLTGKTDWANLVRELAGLDLLLTPDTGVMHLAAHLGVPVMAFFLSSAWCHETGPYGQGHIIWQSDTGCSPCLESHACPRNVACLDPFKNQEFARCIANALSGGKIPFIKGLQCWQTSFDSLGQKLDLASGEDQHEKTRRDLRILIGKYLRIDEFEEQPSLPDGSCADLYEKILPPSEWMLPPWRYC